MITQVCMYSYRELYIYTKIQRKEMEVLKGKKKKKKKRNGSSPETDGGVGLGTAL